MSNVEVEVVPLPPSRTPEPVPTEGHQPITGLAFVGLTLYLGTLAGLGPLAIDMYLPSFRKIAGDFKVDQAEIQRTLAAYFVGLAVGQLIYGPVADRYGRKWPLVTGLVLFVVASIGCALAWDVRSLETLRLVEALGGCAEMVIARAIVRDLFDPRRSAKVFASLMLVMGVAPIVAPILGGWIAINMGWRWIFWLLSIAGIAALASTLMFYRESLPYHRRQTHTFFSTLRTYSSLLRHRGFMAYTLSSSFLLAGLFAYVGGCPYVFMKIYQVPESRFGLFFGMNAMGFISLSQVNSFLVDHFDMRKILRAAMAFSTAAGLLLLMTALTGLGGFVGILVPLFFVVASFGLIFPNAGALAMAPHGRIAGNASAVLGFFQFGVSAIGGMIVSTIQNGTPIPMAATIATCSVIGLVILLYLGRIDSEPQVHMAEHAAH